MLVRRAVADDLPAINSLLRQVLMVHHEGRPDLFKPNTKKYTDEELLQILADDERPIFVAQDEAGEVLGYAFCVWEVYSDHNTMVDRKTLYIDDICVDEGARGRHIGSTLYEHVLNYAREQGFYNVTLNVWSCNPGAMAFYERLGMTPYKVGMEQVL